ncbi:hypothetical protein AAXE64_27485 [Priestia megaterium]
MNIKEIAATDMELDLLKRGFDRFSVQEKNNLISYLSNKYELAYTDITEEYILAHHKKLKCSVLDAMCDTTIEGGIVSEVNGHHYRVNKDDQRMMLGQKEFLNSFPEEETVEWRTEDAGMIDHSRDEWIAMYYESFKFVSMNLKKVNELKRMIDLATTHQEIIAVNWE